jgi:hypothetical protein
MFVQARSVMPNGWLTATHCFNLNRINRQPIVGHYVAVAAVHWACFLGWEY